MHQYQSIEGGVTPKHDEPEDDGVSPGYRSLVFGGVDGIISSMTIISAAIGRLYYNYI
jgi:hypothetical protein